MTTQPKYIEGQADKTVVSTSSSGLPKWKQSPLDLNKIYTWSKNFSPLRLHSYWQTERSAKMLNTGETVKIELSDRILPGISGGPLKDYYQFDNIQFRWGPSNCRGAEHSVDNLWYSMEAQIMHWNIQYEMLEKCYEKSDGIAILSFLLQVVGCPEAPDNPLLADITNNLYKIKKTGNTVRIPFDLQWISEACSINGYYTYEGSLTIEPYDECVTWIIIPRPIKLSSRQANAFREICNTRLEPIVKNYRSQQALNKRRIFYATDDTTA